MLKKADVINAVNGLAGEDIGLQLLQEKRYLMQKIAQAEQDIRKAGII